MGKHSLILSEPGVSHNGPEDGGQVAESHKSVIDGGGQVIVPAQKVPKVQHQDRCGQAGQTRYNNNSIVNLRLSSEIFSDMTYDISN